MTSSELEQLHTDLVRVIRSIDQDHQKREMAPPGMWEAVGMMVMDARLTFLYQGKPDVFGRSQEYKTFMSNVLDVAGVDWHTDITFTTAFHLAVKHEIWLRGADDAGDES